MKKQTPIQEQMVISKELYDKNPFVKQRIKDEQEHYYWLGLTEGKHRFNGLNFFQGLCIGFIIGTTIVKIVL